jgi:glyoxylase-like metal-dependent hydrolase (beta-lactamase superfamily II)
MPRRSGLRLRPLTDSVFVAHTPLVNWTLVIDSTGVLLVDAGFPGNRDDVLTSLAEVGCGPADVRAILLTHAHVDHLGAAIWFAAAHGVAVYCHGDEVGHARRDYLHQASPAALLAHAWRPRWLAWSAQAARLGGLVRDGVPGAAALTDPIAATLPGRPVAVPTPGHTDGHCSYLFDGVLVAGDALITGHPLARDTGPQLPLALFNHSEEGCRASLQAIAATGAGVLVPGHGEVWTGPVGDAVRRVSSAPGPGRR